MKGMEKHTDDEIFAEFMRLFCDAREAADLMEYEHTTAVSTLVFRKLLKRYKIASRFAVYSRAEVESRAANRPGKGGRPKKGD